MAKLEFSFRGNGDFYPYREERTIEGIIKRIIVEVLTEFGVEADKIILFGSRARGNFDEKSDWDILVILKKEVSQKVEQEIFKRITVRLSEMLIPCDILIRTPQQVKRFEGYVHSVTKTALREGKVL
ncbi:nucleotidyltransferase domain-containing protein [Thermatribacter velox]|uniref:Nucleotidyltransferase domain-containing protein n=1 Tax=Thermatribacter velox TaxID=3039681 RepID=A0ABZ2Y9M0_9BACT